MSLRYELILRVQRNNRNMKCLCILLLVLASNSHDWMLLSLGRNARTYKPSIVWTSGQPVFETKTSIWGSALIRTSGTLWNWSLSIYVDHEQALGTRRKNRKTKKVWQNFSSIWKNISTSPGRDASPSQVIRPQFVRSFPTILPYPFILLGGERHCETQWGTVSPARDRTRTARSGDERTNHESTVSVASEI